MGDEAGEVLVTILILGEEDEVVVAIGLGFGLVIALGDVHFAADDGVDVFGFGGVVELDGSEEVAVVGHGDGGHFQVGGDVHHLGDFAGSIEEGVIGVAVEMDEGRVSHRGLPDSAWGRRGRLVLILRGLGAGWGRCGGFRAEMQVSQQDVSEWAHLWLACWLRVMEVDREGGIIFCLVAGSAAWGWGEL